MTIYNPYLYDILGYKKSIQVGFSKSNIPFTLSKIAVDKTLLCFSNNINCYFWYNNICYWAYESIKSAKIFGYKKMLPNIYISLIS